ncbi:MAG: M15 family metallopeptidase [Clostridia bacterium]
MKKIIVILLACTVLSACSFLSQQDEIEQNILTEIVETEIVETDVDEEIVEEYEIAEDVEVEPEEDIYVRSEETVNINDFTEQEIIELKQRFFTQGVQLNVSGEIDDDVITALKTIALDEDLADGVINIDDLLEFFALTDSNFADTSDGYLMLTNKSLALRYDYVPETTKVVNVDSTKTIYLETETAEAMEAMFKAALNDGIRLVLVSGYRDFDYQNMLFERKVASIGYEDANKIVARPGESEHQTGFVADVSCSSVGYSLVENFDETQEYQWLAENAANYGFILRYLEDKVDVTGYTYEPWHYRYVGDVEIAKFITENHLTLEEYHELYMN